MFIALEGKVVLQSGKAAKDYANAECSRPDTQFNGEIKITNSYRNNNNTEVLTCRKYTVINAIK